MFKFVILLSVVACALGTIISEGLLPKLSGHILGGSLTTNIDFPHMVSVQGPGICGGSLITVNVVVTAAHCVEGAPASKLNVVAGARLLNIGVDRLKVSRTIIHANYSSTTMANDIALLRLSKPVTLSPNIQPIALASSNPANGASAVVTGWGNLISNLLPKFLFKMEVKFLDYTSCGIHYSNVLDTHVCAFRENAFMGDSGSPLVYNNKLIGISSWGRTTLGSPTGYTSIPSHYDWINANTED
ncbi:trypsin delta-like [Drosophila busckii]|uniref:trypsin delta-like n=1 Tax=Drosophila busckii TaxID=30019 RepID=UPI00083EF858|nr:trypsin delta-like [Drosophila busckii]